MHWKIRECPGIFYWAAAALASAPLACGLPACALAATDPPAPTALAQLPSPTHDRAELVRGARRLIESERATFEIAAAAEAFGSEPATLFATAGARCADNRSTPPPDRAARPGCDRVV